MEVLSICWFLALSCKILFAYKLFFEKSWQSPLVVDFLKFHFHQYIFPINSWRRKMQGLEFFRWKSKRSEVFVFPLKNEGFWVFQRKKGIRMVEILEQQELGQINFARSPQVRDTRYVLVLSKFLTLRFAQYKLESHITFILEYQHHDNFISGA